MDKLKNSKNTPKKERLWLFLAAGIVVAGIIFLYMDSQKHDDPYFHEWSAEMDSVFVKNCYDKYKPQVRDDMGKQENMKAFCKCMLEKIKTKYSENEMSKVTGVDIKDWDEQCRSELLTPFVPESK